MRASFISIIVCCLFASMALKAQPTPMLNLPYSPSQIETAINNNSREPIFFNDLITYSLDGAGHIDETTLSETTPSSFRVDSLTYVLSFRTNPYASAADLEGKSFIATLDYKLIYYSDAGGLDSTDILQIQVDYDALGGTNYTAKAYKLLPDQAYVRLRMLDLEILDRNTKSEVTNVALFDDILELRQNLSQARTYRPIPSEAPTVPFAAQTPDNAYLRFTWKALNWAQSYELEYLYVDNYGDNGSFKLPEHIPYDFRFNSTRIDVPAQGSGLQEYSIPNIFDFGYVVFRVRGVGSWGTQPAQRIAGAWTLPDQADGLPGTPGSLQAVVVPLLSSNDIHEDGAMNWQHLAYLTEDGKRKDLITYRDGTFRDRQSSTQINTDNQIITSEQIYDHAGRAAIQFLPTPHHPGTPEAKPTFGYYPDFNLDGTGKPFNPTHFDLADNDCSDPFPGAGNPVSNTSGAGNYYSAANPDKDDQQAYTPDANGYPYAQTEFTPDQTGRVRRQGKFGDAFQLGSGHETKYFYTSPSQDELDRVFGIDAGYAAHYLKTVMIDANGQTQISYTDSDGNLVATAYAGESPDNLVPLDNPSTQNISLQLLDAGSVADLTENSLFSSRSVYISGEPGNLIPVSLQYEVSNGSFTPEDCPNACYSCVYDVLISIQKDCGTLVFDTTFTVGSLAELLNCGPNETLFNRNLQLEAGEYQCSRKLIVNAEAVEAAVNEYLDNCVDLLIPLLPPGSCLPSPCKACPPVEESYTNYGDASYNYQSGGSITLPTLFPPIADPDCSTFCEDDLPNILETTFQTLLADVGPGGQYGSYIDTSRTGDDPRGLIDPEIFPLSVFNTRHVSAGTGNYNRLPLENAHWRNPAGGVYRNRDGSESWVSIPHTESGELATDYYRSGAIVQIVDGIARVQPHNIQRLKDFVAVWQTSWAYALVVYHPEYPYYLYSRNFYDSYETEQQIQQTEFYVDAQGDFSSLTDTDFNNDFAGDPFLDGVSGARSAFQNLAGTYIRKEESNPDLVEDYNILQATAITVHCGHPLYSPAELQTCQSSNPIFTSGNFEIMDAEWQVYRAMAISVKQKVLEDFRQDWIDANAYFSNEGIGSETDALYADKNKRFPTQTDIAYTFPDATGADFTDDWEEFRKNYEYQRRQGCGICPAVDGLTALMNALLGSGRFEQTTSFPSAPNLSFPEALISELGISTSAPIIWDPYDNNLFSQKINILADGSATPITNFYFETHQIPFAQIKLITCVQVTDNPSGDGFNFFAKGFSETLDSTTILGYISNEISLAACTLEPACRDAAFAFDMKVFLTYIFQNSIYDNTNHDLYNPFSFNPALTDRMETQLEDLNVSDWRWDLFSLNAAGTSLLVDWQFTFSGGGTANPIFDMTIADPSFDIRDVEEVIAIRKRPGDPSTGLLYDFEFVARDINGFEFVVSVNTSNTFFPMLNCTPPDVDKESDEAFCCITPIRYNPGPDCEEIFADIAEGNRQLEEDGILEEMAASFRTAYITHCLDAAEQLTADYNEKLYQFTLYYYDQANNLVKTVPPKGVDQLSDPEVATTQSQRATGSTSLALNNHQLVATSQYNSLNQTVEKSHPDEGITEYTYDPLGRILLSRDAAQLANDQANYLAYDPLGRIQEQGTVAYSSANLPSQMDIATFNSILSSGLKENVYTNHYDESLPGTDAFFQLQNRQLRNRISSRVFRKTAAGPADHATHYGYDILGNVQTLAQEFSRLEREFPIGPDCATHPLIFENETVEDGTYQSMQQIETNGNVVVEHFSDVTFRSQTSILLRPGFTAGSGFVAQIGPCEPSEGMADIPQHLKIVQYDYDLFSGKVNKIWYQPGKEDQFIHYYQYDADNRLVNLSTSRFPEEPEDLRDIDAQYTYYQHGPLARIAIGQELVQGLDYAYTINGWMKGMNSATLFPERDMGHDGQSGSIHALFGQDAFGFELGYFTDDYQSIQSFTTAQRFWTDVSPPLPTADFQGLYNGNIWYWTNANQGFSTNPIQLHAFQYDQLNRLTQSSLLQQPDLTTNSWTGSFSNNYASTYSYDANGNFMKLVRQDGSGGLLDELTYHYDAGTNQLNHVDDGQTTSYPLDLEDQDNNNYTYDVKGRLLTDEAEQVDAMEWMPNDRLETITQNGQTIEFQYNAQGQRVLKKADSQTTYYVRDDMGNILAVYQIADGETTWKYSPILGSSRIGTFTPNEILDGLMPETIAQVRGQRQYELTNHLGNVQALISDRKIPVTASAFTADVRNASDFYPFGMLMPDRQETTQSYAFGFHGLERDDEVKGEGNSYTTEFRQYDPRIGRWLSVDQLFKPHESAYAGFANNPVNYLDATGLDTTLSVEEYQELYVETARELYRTNFTFNSSLNRIMMVQREIDELIDHVQSNPEYAGSRPLAIALGVAQIRDREGPGLNRDLEYINSYVQQTIQNDLGPFTVSAEPETPEAEYEPLPPPIDYPTIGPPSPGVRPMTQEEIEAIRNPGAAFRRDLTLLRTNVFGALTYVIARNRGFNNEDAMARAHVAGGVWNMASGLAPRTPSPTNLIGSSRVNTQTRDSRINYTVRPSN